MKAQAHLTTFKLGALTTESLPTTDWSRMPAL
jgi:hypothetical protein